jgi:Kelch motif
MSSSRRRGLVRLSILIASLVGLVAVGVSVIDGSGGGSRPGPVARAASEGRARLVAEESRLRLPVALHGLAVTPGPDGLLAVGGADSGDVSKDTVYRLDPGTGSTKPAGTLVQPLHDAAATAVGGRALVFGGGNTSTLDLVQALSPGGSANQVGRLPAAISDLAAVSLGGAAYVLGGFDGTSPRASILRTTDGRAFTRVGRLPTPVRYAAVATLPDKIYAFGGELADGSDSDQIQEYDIARGRTVIAGHLPEPVSHASAVTLNDAIYVLGGRIAGAASDRILRLDPSGSVVRPVGRLPQPVYDGAAGTYRGHAYLVGGLGTGGSPLASVVALR